MSNSMNKDGMPAVARALAGQNGTDVAYLTDGPDEGNERLEVTVQRENGNDEEYVLEMRRDGTYITGNGKNADVNRLLEDTEVTIEIGRGGAQLFYN